MNFEKFLIEERFAALESLLHLSEVFAAIVFFFFGVFEVVKTIRDAGRKVFVVGSMVVGLETDNWRRAQAAGVDGIMTEFPLECRRALHF